MANRNIYTRAYSSSSAGRLNSAKAPKGDPLSHLTLLEEFRKHAGKRNREPTALVSVSDRIVDTVKRAFDKHYEYGDSAEDIWIAFIKVPPPMNESATRIHSAKELAEACGFWEPDLFFHEFVVEWAVPEQYVLHRVSLQTLVDRKLQEHCFLQPDTAEVRNSIATQFQNNSPWEIGVNLGTFARKFGARAPLDWVSHQLFHDCVWADIEDNDVLKVFHANKTRFLYELDGGIDTALLEWWLSDAEFFSNYENFKGEREVTEDRMIWDLIDFWEARQGVDFDEKPTELYAEEQLLYDEENDNLLVKHARMRAEIEAEAVKIGL